MNEWSKRHPPTTNNRTKIVVVTLRIDRVGCVRVEGVEMHLHLFYPCINLLLLIANGLLILTIRSNIEVILSNSILKKKLHKKVVGKPLLI